MTRRQDLRTLRRIMQAQLQTHIYLSYDNYNNHERFKLNYLFAWGNISRLIRGCGGMADALASGASDRKVVRVQVPSSAPSDPGGGSLFLFYLIYIPEVLV